MKSPYQPPAVYDPLKGMVVPGNLGNQLRALFNKTADAHGNVDYPERVKLALIAVYDLGRRTALSAAPRPDAGEGLVEARLAWHRQRGATPGLSCPTAEMCESFDAGWEAARALGREEGK